jgi:hypothetical protein
MTWRASRDGDRHEAFDHETGELRACVWRPTDERWLCVRLSVIGDRPLGQRRTAEAARELVDQKIG